MKINVTKFKTSFLGFLVSLIFVLYQSSFAQLQGEYSIPGDYATISAAIADLNSQGVGSGGVTFNVAAGYTESISSGLTITATGTASNPIVFQKSGSGANPVITRTDAGTNSTSTLGGLGDAVIRLDGTDYITFDGIDVAATNQGIEYGYFTYKPSGTNGCQYVTIKNCSITMTKGTSGYVIGIYISNGPTSVSSVTGVTVTASSGINSNITITGNTISNVHAGIYVRGSSASGFYDSDVVIGQVGAGNTITNFGGGNASTTYGVYFIYVNNPTVAYNTITSATHGSTLYGIFYSTVTGNVVGSNNNITLSNNSSSSETRYISNGSSVTSETFDNNTFAAGTLSSTGTVYLIYASNATPNKSISGNQISGTINRTATSGSFYCYYNLGSPSSGTETISNNNFSNITVAGSSSLYGIYTNTATGQNRVCSNNTVSNLTAGTGSTYAIYVLLTTSNQVYNNSVYNITAGGTVYGLYFTGTNPTVYNNVVRDITTTGSSLYGIYDGGTGTTNCYRNQVYGLTSNSSSTTVTLYGIYITAGTANYVYNNFVSDLKTPSSGSTTGLAGIYVSGGTYVGLYYNTIYLNASSTGTNFGSSGIFASTTPTVDLRNNIVVNLSTPNGTGLTVAYRRSSTTLTTYSSTSNNNLFYAGTPSANRLIFYDGTNSDQTLASFKTRVSPRDASSVTENPPFVNTSSTPYDLHIDPTVPTQIESGGTPISSPISISDDFDGDTRNATTPDIGADEGDFTLADLTPPNISFTPLGNSIVASNRTFSNVVITDPSGVDVNSGTKPRVYYKKKSDPNNIDGWVYVEANNSSSPFTFTIDYSLLNDGSVSVGDTIQYFVVAQDMNATPNVGIMSGSFANPQSSVDLQDDAFPIGGTIYSYAIVGTISGTITVGTGGTYPSLTGAGGLFADINSKVVTGNITAQIISNLSEDGSNALNQWSESPEGSNFTLSIVPSDASNKTISGSYNGGLIRLNGADGVTIDGRYGGSGNYLTITNTSTSDSIAAIQLIGSASGQGCQNVTIRNCNISTGSPSSVSYAIFAGGSTVGSAGYDHDNLVILNNNIYKAYYGIYVAGSSGAACDNVSILNNEIGSDNASDYVYKYGIYMSYVNNAEISQNHIFNMSSTTATPVGIYAYYGVTNTVISKNKIHNIAYTGTAGYGGWGIYLNTNNSSSNVTIHTNLIYDIKGDGYSSFSNSSMVGIYIDGTTGGLKIYYNTVNLYGSFAGYTTATKTAAILFNSSTITDIDLRNNIFVNSMDNTSGTSDKNYAIYSSTAATNFTNINYNDYYASGPQGVLGFIGGSDRTTLSAWQTATGQDGNSIASSPSFVADNDLRPSSGSPVLGAGTPITGITTDYLGASRSATAPSMGAYENPFVPSTPPNCAVLSSPANGVTGVSVTPTLQWSDGGGGTTGYKLYFGTDNPPTNIHNGTNLGNVTSYTFSTSLNYLTTYYWKIVAYNSNGDNSGCEVRSFTTTANPSSIPLHVTFDPSDFPPAGWDNVGVTDPTKKWARVESGSNPSTTPKSGTGMAYFNCYLFSAGTSAMLISPALNIPNDNYRLEFWMYRDNYGTYGSYGDKVDVYINSTNDTVGGTRLGTINRSTTLSPIVASEGWYKYSFDLPSGSSGNPRYLILCGRSAFGNNIFIDEVTFKAIPSSSNDQTITGGSTDPVSFTGTNATIQFTVANTGSLNITCEKIESNPGGSSSLPSGITNLAPVYWSFTVNSGTVNGTFSLTLDITGVPGVNNPSLLRLLRRENASSPWQNLGTPNTVDGNLLTWTGLTSFSDYGLGGDDNNPLPVELTSFTAQVKDRDVTLEWKTATEVNSLGFEIERKAINEKDKSAEKWERVEFVRASGTSNKPMQYSYIDKKLNTGKYAYRLKMVDIDGSFTYSDEIRVEIGKPAITELKQNYPNSFNPETKIEYQLSNPSKVRIEVYNITGELVTTLVDKELEAGYYVEIFNANRVNGGLASGVYIYRMIANDMVTGQRIIQTRKMLLIK